ncbi:ABC transporter ATP-binding protein [Streptomyces erythrochromogenes]|uniref:ABC transporter ATP-binding protein n=1 Tax=Streptomyces erythrochromogenes TaxID=285574 RepID=UPI00380117DD
MNITTSRTSRRSHRRPGRRAAAVTAAVLTTVSLLTACSGPPKNEGGAVTDVHPSASTPPARGEIDSFSNLLADIREQTGIGYLFITHDLGVVRCVTDEIVVMRHGAVVEQGRTEEVLAAPGHPYTRLLLESVPRPGWDPQAIAAARRAL